MLPSRNELEVARRRAIEHLARQYQGQGPQRAGNFPVHHLESASSRAIHQSRADLGAHTHQRVDQADGGGNILQNALGGHPQFGGPGGNRLPTHVPVDVSNGFRVPLPPRPVDIPPPALHPAQRQGGYLDGPYSSPGMVPAQGQGSGGMYHSLVPLGQGLFLHTGTGEIHGLGLGGLGFGQSAQPAAPMMPNSLVR